MSVTLTNRIIKLTQDEREILFSLKLILRDSLTEAGVKFNDEPAMRSLALESLINGVPNMSFPVSTSKIKIIKDFIEEKEKENDKTLFSSLSHLPSEEVRANLTLMKVQGYVREEKNGFYRITTEGLNRVSQIS